MPNIVAIYRRRLRLPADFDLGLFSALCLVPGWVLGSALGFVLGLEPDLASDPGFGFARFFF